MNEAEIKKKLKKYINIKRYEHTLGVLFVSKKLATHYQVNLDQAVTAALLHDCAKELSDSELLRIAATNQIKIDRVIHVEPQLLHGKVGAIIAKQDFQVDDELILDAIRYHTTGRKKMTKLDKIIYLADFIEPKRRYPGLEKLRKVAFINLDKAVLQAMDESLCYLIKKGRLTHKLTVSARNDMIFNLKNI